MFFLEIRGNQFSTGFSRIVLAFALSARHLLAPGIVATLNWNSGASALASLPVVKFDRYKWYEIRQVCRIFHHQLAINKEKTHLLQGVSFNSF